MTDGEVPLVHRRDFLQQAAALAALPVVAPLVPSASARSQQRPLVVNGARLNGWLAQFDRIGRTPGGINRVAYSEADLAGRAFTRDLFAQSGLQLRLDTAGNMFARVPGTDASKAPILIGSHVDSVTPPEP